MVGTFPGANSIADFWRNLKGGIDSISHFTREELLDSGITSRTLDNPDYVMARGYIEGIEHFDASFFGYSPREAELMDPQHRIFLEHAWHALEAAGYAPDLYEGYIGVFAGAANNSYLMNNLASHYKGDMATLVQVDIDNDKDHLTTRVAYKLNLKGPAVSVQTTCSTSLVAVCLAVESLLAGACDIALAGGVSIAIPKKRGYVYRKGGIASPDGKCRTFDAKARGTVFSSGVGIVTLKRLEDALADGDSIWAVIKGAAINNDGALKVGYTAPSIQGQTDVITRALTSAAIRPDQIGYLEAHGTATELGDPIEMAALNQSFLGTAEQRHFCAIGSVKTNVGHLNNAAGIAGLIKAIMCVKEGVLVPTLHFEEPNPAIDFANSAFYVNTQLKPWPSHQCQRRAGVSSFGIGGTNAHVIVEEPPLPLPSQSHRQWRVVPVSARSSASLAQSIQNLRERLANSGAEISAPDVAYTLQVGRKAFSHRFATVSQNKTEMMSCLHSGYGWSEVDARKRVVAFMFPGQGAQYVNATKSLYYDEPSFRAPMDLCCEMFKSHLGLDLRTLLYPDADRIQQVAPLLDVTLYTQPIIFAIDYSLAVLWLKWGIRPAAMIGHSVGEYVAACISGVFSLEDAISMIALRARLMSSMPQGAMLSVSLPAEECEVILREQRSTADIAAVNGPSSTVLSGPEEAVLRFKSRVSQIGVESHILKTSHAFHSSMMDPILEEYSRVFASCRLNKPSIPFISNVSGTWIRDEEAMSPSYWVNHLRNPVQFHLGVNELLENAGADILLEVGPGQVLSGIVRSHVAADGRTPVVISTLGHSRDSRPEGYFLASAVANLWQGGAPVDWKAYNAHESLRRVPLPTYPFERKRYWLDPQPLDVTSLPVSAEAPAPRAPLDQSFYTLGWKRTVPLTSRPLAELLSHPETWLLLGDGAGLASQLENQLAELGHRTIVLRQDVAGCRSDSRGNHQFLDLNHEGEFESLIERLFASNEKPNVIVHMLAATRGENTGKLEAFDSFLSLMKAYARWGRSPQLRIAIVSDGLHGIVGTESQQPEKALLLGPLNVIPREFPTVSTRSIDIERSPCIETEEFMAKAVLTEIALWPAEALVAFRGGHRWVQTCERTTLPDPRPDLLRKGGVYLITGGLGGIGFALARHLLQTSEAHIMIASRRQLPSHEEWQSLPTEDRNLGPMSQSIKNLMDLQANGSDIVCMQADVADEAQTREVIAEINRRWGRLDGVIHAAGVAGGGIIELKTRDDASRVLSPKFEGTSNLLKALESQRIQFIALCSSVESVSGSSGQVDYSAGNAYLDAMAHVHSGHNKTPIISINWCTWRDVGMAVYTPVPVAMQKHRSASLKAGLSNAEGVEAFLRIIDSQLRQAIVAPSGISLPVAVPYTQALALAPSVAAAQQTRNLHPRPSLNVPYKAPSNETEVTLAAIWTDLLGVKDIGIDDNFFSLGGHSLMAVRLTFRIRSEFNVEFALNDLFQAPTIARMEDTILLHLTSGLEDQSLLQLLNEIDESRTGPISLDLRSQ